MRRLFFHIIGKTCAVAAYRQLEDPTKFPKYHSRSMDSAETFYFDVDILHSNLHQPKIVIIINSIWFFYQFFPLHSFLSYIYIYITSVYVCNTNKSYFFYRFFLQSLETSSDSFHMTNSHVALIMDTSIFSISSIKIMNIQPCN